MKWGKVTARVLVYLAILFFIVSVAGGLFVTFHTRPVYAFVDEVPKDDFPQALPIIFVSDGKPESLAIEHYLYGVDQQILLLAPIAKKKVDVFKVMSTDPEIVYLVAALNGELKYPCVFIGGRELVGANDIVGSLYSLISSASDADRIRSYRVLQLSGVGTSAPVICKTRIATGVRSTTSVISTAYTPCVEECDADPWTTATGAKSGLGLIAVDPRMVNFGTIVFVDGYGYAIVADTGGLIKDRRIDCLFLTKTEALNWGYQRTWLTQYS